MFVWTLREQRLFRWSAAGTCLKTHKTWGQRVLSKPAWFGKHFGKSILGALLFSLGKSQWFHLPLAVQSCRAGGREGAGEAVFDSRFSGSLFNGAPASLNLVYLWLLLCFVSRDFNTLWGFLWQNFGSFFFFSCRHWVPVLPSQPVQLGELCFPPWSEVFPIGVTVHWSCLGQGWRFRSLWVIPLCVERSRCSSCWLSPCVWHYVALARAQYSFPTSCAADVLLFH